MEIGRLRGMRVILVLILTLFALPAAAQDWGHYVNERFGVEVDVPPGFEQGEPPANGDGLTFSTPTAELAVFGSFMVAENFEADVARQIQYAEDDGWNVTYQAVTPSWASWSGKRGSRILYVRAVPICGGAGVGAFQLTYMDADLKAFDPVVNRLVKSLKDAGTGWQC